MNHLPIRYLVIYRAIMPPPSEEVCLAKESNFRVSLQAGPIKFSYSVHVKEYKPLTATLRVTPRQVKLPADCYLVIEIETQGTDPRSTIGRAALRVAETASLFDLRYPDVIAEKIYEGVVNTPRSDIYIPESPVTVRAQSVLDPGTVATEVAADLTVLTQLPSDRRDRYQLAARWFRRGHETTNLVDRLLFWWTVLEIYPGEGEGKDIPNRTCDLLVCRVYPNLSREKVKGMIGIGRIFGLRGDIIHEGKAFVKANEEDQFLDYLEQLRATAATCLRLLADLPPGQDLDRYTRP